MLKGGRFLLSAQKRSAFHVVSRRLGHVLFPWLEQSQRKSQQGDQLFGDPATVSFKLGGRGGALLL